MHYQEMPARIREIIEKDGELTRQEHEEIRTYYMALTEEHNV